MEHYHHRATIFHRNADCRTIQLAAQSNNSSCNNVRYGCHFANGHAGPRLGLTETAPFYPLVI